MSNIPGTPFEIPRTPLERPTAHFGISRGSQEFRNYVFQLPDAADKHPM